MVKSPIRVFVRTRPVVRHSSKHLSINEEEGHIHLNIPRNEALGHINHLPENKTFKFDGILRNVPQEGVFDTVARDTIKGALEGFSGTVFCYGQTGAGKTFTMSGSTSSYQERGIIPRTISALFKEIAGRPNEQFEIKASYLEIYNEVMLDLLGEYQDSMITINESAKGNILVKGLKQFLCKKEDDCLNLLFQGEINKTMASHNLNQNSSRSHSIFTLYIQSKARIGSTKKTTFSKIHLVDLAGSERTKKTGSEGQTLIEANYINKSLSFLEQVVIALCEKRDHVPYRQSKLTSFLKDSLGGNCKTTMIANIWPEASNLEETVSTLKFATRIKNVSNEAIANVWLDEASPMKRQHSRAIFSFSEQYNEENLTPEEQLSLNKVARRFLQGKIEDIEIKSHGQVKELFNQFRNIYQDLYDATKEFFHLIPDEKLKRLGIKVDKVALERLERAMIANQSQKHESPEELEDFLSMKNKENSGQLFISGLNSVRSGSMQSLTSDHKQVDIPLLKFLAEKDDEPGRYFMPSKGSELKPKEEEKVKRVRPGEKFKETEEKEQNEGNTEFRRDAIRQLRDRVRKIQEKSVVKEESNMKLNANKDEVFLLETEEENEVEQRKEAKEIGSKRHSEDNKDLEKDNFIRLRDRARQKSEKIQASTDKEKSVRRPNNDFKFYGNENEVLYLETEEEHYDEMDIKAIKQRFKVRAEVLNNIKTKPFLSKPSMTDDLDYYPQTDRPHTSQRIWQDGSSKRNEKAELITKNDDYVRPLSHRK